jgi:hypothetical protein
VRIEHYEGQNPGFTEFVSEAVRQYGDLTWEASNVIWGSAHGPEIIARLYMNAPEFVADLNQMPQREVELFVAHMSGLLQGQMTGGGGAPAVPIPFPKAKIVSQAPKPVETVAGKAGAPGKTPEEMDYSEYRAWRMRGKRRA